MFYSFIFLSGILFCLFVWCFVCLFDCSCLFCSFNCPVYLLYVDSALWAPCTFYSIVVFVLQMANKLNWTELILHYCCLSIQFYTFSSHAFFAANFSQCFVLEALFLRSFLSLDEVSVKRIKWTIPDQTVEINVT